METRRTAAAVVAIALLAWSPVSAQHGYGVAVETMQQFLDAWQPVVKSPRRTETGGAPG